MYSRRWLALKASKVAAAFALRRRAAARSSGTAAGRFVFEGARRGAFTPSSLRRIASFT
jgi:hypothetical protein